MNLIILSLDAHVAQVRTNAWNQPAAQKSTPGGQKSMVAVIDPETPWVHNTLVADVKVRKVPDWVIESFRARAAALGHSLEEELRSLLTEVARARRQEFVAETSAFQERLRTRYGQLSDSTRGLTEDREQRG